MDEKNITVYDIAKEAKVSPATVSRVLTGNARVSDEKRKKVEEIIQKYNFQPNALARSLFRKESKTIGFILPDITNPFFSSTFLEIEKYALDKGYTMMLCNSMNNIELEYTHLRRLTEKQVDAIVFMGGRVNQVTTKEKYANEMNQIIKKTPIVIVNGKMTGVDCYKVVTDEEKGIFDLIEYLISLRHTKIGLLGGIPDITSTHIKQKAFRKAIDEFDLEMNDNWIIPGGFSIESGFESMISLMKNKEKPTAIIAINDFVAIGAIRAVNFLGLKVPDDISITGFDGSYISEIVTPQLTTVSQNFSIIGKVVVETIMDVIVKKQTEKQKVIQTKLIIRDSCCKLRNY